MPDWVIAIGGLALLIGLPMYLLWGGTRRHDRGGNDSSSAGGDGHYLGGGGHHGGGDGHHGGGDAGGGGH